MTLTVRLPLPGGCPCGASRYELKGRPLLVYVCHCHTCQSRSGAAFTLNMVVEAKHLVRSGAFRTRQSTRTSGREIESSYCGECGTALSARAPAAPDYMTLLAGTLDDANWVRPSAQTFVESAIPWAVIASVRSVPWGEFDFVELGLDWLRSAPRFLSDEQD